MLAAITTTMAAIRIVATTVLTPRSSLPVIRHLGAADANVNHDLLLRRRAHRCIAPPISRGTSFQYSLIRSVTTTRPAPRAQQPRASERRDGGVRHYTR